MICQQCGEKTHIVKGVQINLSYWRIHRCPKCARAFFTREMEEEPAFNFWRAMKEAREVASWEACE